MRISSTSSPDMRPRRPAALSRAQRRATGFSMVELLIAIVLGLLVVAGLINLFIANRKAYQVQSGNNFIQENLRLATDRMSSSIRMADYWAGNKAINVTGSGGKTITAKGKCSGAWATALTASTSGGGGVYGYNGGTSFPIDSACVDDSANYIAGTDVLVLRYADAQALSPGPADATTPATASTITGNASEVFLLATPGVSGELFAGKVPTTTTAKLQRYAYPFQLDMYYLRPCSVIGSGSACASTDDGGLPLPTLMRMHLQPDGTFASDPVVSGIEQLKLEYGVTSDPANVIPTYQDAGTVTTNGQWANVVSVRVNMVSVNPNRDVTMPHTGTYTLGNCTYVIKNGSAADVSKCTGFTPFGDKPWQFARAQQQIVVQLRNRIRG